MRPVIAWDTETRLITPGLNAPPLVCVSWQRPGQEARLRHVNDARHVVESWLRDPDVILVGHNVAYDMGVIAAKWPDLMPAIFAAYEADRVTDTMIRAQLLDIASGKKRGYMRDGAWHKPTYHLDDLCVRFLGRKLDKDTWRLRYAELESVPLEAWPADAQAYPKEDARATLDIYLSQEVHASYLGNQFFQTRADWFLKLTSTWGLRTSHEAVEQLERETNKAIAEVQNRLIAAGLVRKDGSRDTKKAKAHIIRVCEEKGLPLRLTKTDGVCLDADACRATEDDLLEDYAEFTTLKKVTSADLPALYSGVDYPIHTRYGLAETGRTTSSKPNVQNWRRGE